MFTGFASENTPAIQVWDCTRNIASISLQDDCAPIQFFKTGGVTAAIRVNLPNAPAEGRRIAFINNTYAINEQPLNLFFTDISGAVSSYYVGSGQTIELCYTKQAISATGNGVSTGWICLSQGSASSSTVGSFVVGNSNRTRNNEVAVIGGFNNFVYSPGSGIFCGRNNQIGAQYAAVIGGESSQANANFSAVVGGASNTASGTNSAVVGGASNSASGQNAGILSGNSSFASGINAVVLGGDTNTANAFNSAVVSGAYGTTRNITGIQVSPASRNPIAGFSGVQQSSVLIVGRQTTNATATRLASDTAAADTTNQVILPNNSAYYFRGSITSGVTGGGNSAMWTFEGGIKRGANAASTTIIQSVINPVAADAGASSWIVALSADTTNGGLAVTVTGQAATTIRWVCKIETTEMTF
jgi:hypothetical protein